MPEYLAVYTVKWTEQIDDFEASGFSKLDDRHEKKYHFFTESNYRKALKTAKILQTDKNGEILKKYPEGKATLEKLVQCIDIPLNIGNITY